MLFDDQIYISTFFAYGHRLCAKPYSTQWVKLDNTGLFHTFQTTKADYIAISYQKRHEGIYLLVDSTGLEFLGEDEWKRKKYQPEYRRQWRKLHFGINAKTLQIRAVQLTTNNVSDSQVLGDR